MMPSILGLSTTEGDTARTASSQQNQPGTCHFRSRRRVRPHLSLQHNWNVQHSDDGLNARNLHKLERQLLELDLHEHRDVGLLLFFFFLFLLLYFPERAEEAAGEPPDRRSQSASLSSESARPSAIMASVWSILRSSIFAISFASFFASFSAAFLSSSSSSSFLWRSRRACARRNCTAAVSRVSPPPRTGCARGGGGSGGGPDYDLTQWDSAIGGQLTSG